MDSQLRARYNLHCLYALSVAHSWKSISSLCGPIVIYIIFGRSQLHAPGNSKSIFFFVLSCALMPDWRIKEHQDNKYSPGSKNPGNKHARVGQPDSGLDLSVQSPFSGGPSLFYLNVQRFHWARSYTIAKMQAPLG